MNCDQAGKLHQSYLDGDLSNQVRMEVDAHVIRCPQCQESLALLEAVANVVSEPPAGGLSEDFTDRVVATVQAGGGGRRARQTARWAIGFISAAAAVMALALLLPERRAGRADRTDEPSENLVVANAGEAGAPGPALLGPPVAYVKGAVGNVKLAPLLKAAEERFNEGLKELGSDDESTTGLDLLWSTIGLSPDVAS